MIDESIQKEIISFTQEIVRINSPSGNEEGVAKVVHEKMKSLNFNSIQVDSFGNVIAFRKGELPGPVILFDGHMDVVPVTNIEKWQCNPFSADLQDGKIWGRGATDMKGPLAAAIVALGHIPKNEFCGTLVVSASVGEEVHEGAAIAKVVQAVNPDFVVICEPSECCVSISQKGRAGIWIEVNGKPAHSSSPQLGENAIYKSQKVIDRLRKMDLPNDPKIGKGIMELISAISYPYPSQSTLPVSFKMHYDRRLVQGETKESVLESIKLALHGLQDWHAGFMITNFHTYTGLILDEIDFHPGWSSDSTSPWIKRALSGLQENGLKARLSSSYFCTNGSYTAGVARIPTMIYGPSSVTLAHQINEYIEISELIQGAEGYMSLARNLGRCE